MARRWMLLLTMLAACTCPPVSHAAQQFAPDQVFHNQIKACAGDHDCTALCTDLFLLTTDDELRSCRVLGVTDLGANVAVAYDSYNTCGVDGDVGVDDGYVDDGDDGSTDDGSTDDGSDDGSTDDGGTGDDGGGTGDDGGGGDGSSDRHLHSPHAPRITTAAAAR